MADLMKPAYVAQRMLSNRTSRLLRGAMRRVASRLGYGRPGPLDMRGVVSDPIEALRQADGRRPVLLDVPLARCRSLGVVAFPPTITSGHPYVLTAREYLAGNLHGYGGSPLQAYYEHVQPRTAAELLDVPDASHTSSLRHVDALHADFPWLTSPGPHVKAGRFKSMEADAREAGVELRGEDGWNPIGPISPAKARWEIDRTIRVVESIKRDGYWEVPLNKHIAGYLLWAGDRYAVMIWGGEHRVDALAALGYDHVPLLFAPHRVAYRNAVRDWPGVASGAFTLEQALHIFDRVIDGRQPNGIAAVWPTVWRGRWQAEPAPSRADRLADRSPRGRGRGGAVSTESN
jgi:hypothetical protein